MEVRGVTLAGDDVLHDDIEGRDAVGGDEQENGGVALNSEDITDLAAVQELQAGEGTA